MVSSWPGYEMAVIFNLLILIEIKETVFLS